MDYTLIEILFPIALFVCTVAVLMSGYQVAFSLAGVSLLFAIFGAITGYFDIELLGAFPGRLFGVMMNDTLIAIPLFVLMGAVLERSRVSESLLETMALALGRMPGGLGVSICLVGALLAASTGIVGATVVAMGMIALPAMLKRGYRPELACGIVAASGTLGQIIPPSIILIILGDQIMAANQQAQLARGDFSGDAVTVGDLFAGALIPGVLLAIAYMVYTLAVAYFKPEHAPRTSDAERAELAPGELRRRIVRALAPPLILMIGVLGSILGGFATPTEAASVGVVGALILAAVNGEMNWKNLRDIGENTLRINAMVFMILIGASFFSLVFRGFEGDFMVEDALLGLPGGRWAAFLIVMLVVFILGFFLDFFEITFIVMPVIGPILLGMGFDPIWLGVMIALNLQTSFLTPPFGFALFYLRGVAPPSVSTLQIYRGAVPFIVLQLLVLALVGFWPTLATWLPHYVYGP